MSADGLDHQGLRAHVAARLRESFSAAESAAKFGSTTAKAMLVATSLKDALQRMLSHDPESGCCENGLCGAMEDAVDALERAGADFAPGCRHWPNGSETCPQCKAARS
jgi:hypothetical protein